jgi:hypothetical protein
MQFSLRILLIITTSLPLFSSVGLAFDCIQGIDKYLHFDFAQLRAKKTSISRQNPISIGLAQDAYFLKFQFEKKITQLNPVHQNICRAQAAEAYRDLLQYFVRRLEHLLDDHLTVTFAQESAYVLAPRITREEKADVSSLFSHKLTPRYLALLREELNNELSTTRWTFYTNIFAELTIWDEEWSILTGREAPAAVWFERAQIALRPLEYTAEESKIFLFHELSHLASSRKGLENEIDAWAETLAFLESRERKGIACPSIFQRVREAVQFQGLDVWVRGVISRRQSR